MVQNFVVAVVVVVDVEVGVVIVIVIGPVVGFPALPSAQRLHDVQAVLVNKRTLQIERLFSVDEEPHVRSHLVLLVDDSKQNSRISPVQVRQYFRYRRARCLDLALFRVRKQRRWDENSHARSPVSTA